MKQLLFLFLFPCLAMAQYTGNAGQKITLGEQTTADGLVFRGVLNDTLLITPFSDTSAYIILDTVNNRFYNYNRATNVWSLAGGGVSVTSFSAGTTGLTPSTATTGPVTLGGTLAVANGGTGSATKNFVDLTTAQTVDGQKTFTSPPRMNIALLLGTSTDKTNVAIPIYVANYDRDSTPFVALLGVSVPNESALDFGGGSSAFNSATQIRFYTSTAVHTSLGTARMIIKNTGNVGIGTQSPDVQFHTTGNVRFAGLTSITDLRTDADGDLYNGSDFNLKNSIDSINFGLSDVLKLKPVSFNWNDEARNINEYKSMGFIAQDIMDVIPNAASTMGDGDMQVDYNAIVATLTKAIQEQQAQIKALEQRLLILENK